MKLLTPAEAGRRYGVTPDTIRNWERRGLPVIKTETGRRLFEERVIDDFVRKRTMKVKTDSNQTS